MIDYKKQKNCHVQLHIQFLLIVCLKIIKFMKIAFICPHMALLYHVNNNLPITESEKYNIT